MSCRKLVPLLFALSMLAATPANAHRGHPDRPSRVVIIVLDQARPDTIDRYGMKNVQKLQQKGKSFPNALVGHMAAETVISHNVLTSGLFPKNMGWSNEVYRDVDNVLGAPGAYHVTSSMSCAQFKALIAHGNYDKLQDYLDTRFGETSKFASIAQKRTSACTSGHTRSTDLEDIIFQIRGSSSTSCDPSQPTQSGWRSPEYANGTPPAYFDLARAAAGPRGRPPAPMGPAASCRRRSTRSTATVSCLASIPAHIGGDTWSADAAIRVIQNDPDWHGMMVSLGAIDKMGHMWGPEDNVTGPRGSDRQVSHLPFAAKNADEQVGQDRRRSQAKGRARRHPHRHHRRSRRADRASLPRPLRPGLVQCGVRRPTSNGIRSDCNWYYGQDADERYLDPSPAVAQLRDRLAGNLAFSYQDGHVAAWLTDNSLAKKRRRRTPCSTCPT